MTVSEDESRYTMLVIRELRKLVMWNPAGNLMVVIFKFRGG